MPGSQIVYCGRIKTSKAKIRRARLGKWGGGGEKNGRESLLAFLQRPSSAHFCHVWIRLSKLLTLQLATIILKFLARAFRVTRTPCANVWKFMSLNFLSCESIRFFRLLFSFTRRSDDQKYICCSQATNSSMASVNIALDHSKCCRFYSNKRGR